MLCREWGKVHMRRRGLEQVMGCAGRQISSCWQQLLHLPLPLPSLCARVSWQVHSPLSHYRLYFTPAIFLWSSRTDHRLSLLRDISYAVFFARYADSSRILPTASDKKKKSNSMQFKQTVAMKLIGTFTWKSQGLIDGFRIHKLSIAMSFVLATHTVIEGQGWQKCTDRTGLHYTGLASVFIDRIHKFLGGLWSLG